MSDENIGKKVQDAEQIGTEKVGDKEIPILKPEVYVKIYCSNCATLKLMMRRRLLAICNDCGKPWAESKAKDVTITCR